LVDPLRSISLEKVAEELCLESDPGRLTWRHEAHQIRINGAQFYNWHETQMKDGVPSAGFGDEGNHGG
jgi:hypothetical protein